MPGTEGGRGRKLFLPCPSPPQKHLPSFLQCLSLPGTFAPSTTLSEPTNPRGQSPTELRVSSQPRALSSIIAEMASEYWRHSCVSHITEILPFQLWNPFMSKSDFEFFFFFIVSTHVFLKCLCSPWSVSDPATPDSEVPIGLGVLFSTIQLSPVNHWGIGHSVVSFTLATEQLETLFCRPGCWHLNHRNNRYSPWDKSQLSPTKPFNTDRQRWERAEGAEARWVSPPCISPAPRALPAQSRSQAAGRTV